MKQMKDNLTRIMTDLGCEIQNMKKELDSCTNILSKRSTKNRNSLTKLSNGIEEVNNKLQKLESSKNQIQLDIKEMTESIRDNSRNSREVMDIETQTKNTNKFHAKEISARIESV